MMLMPQPDGTLRIVLESDEASMLGQLLTQLIRLLQSHSEGALDPDPLFASLEVGGSEAISQDPALARLFPNAYREDENAASFRRVTEQGLLNRKLQDAITVTSALGLGGTPFSDDVIEVDISPESLFVWARTLTALRLAIAARIGLEHESDRTRLSALEQTRGSVVVFDWLAAILESIMSAAEATEDQPPHRGP